MKTFDSKRLKMNPGFTLVELQVVLAVMALLAAVTLTNYIAHLPKYRLRAAVNDITSMLQNARLRAVKENRFVVVLFDPDGDGRLQGDYLAFVDNGNGGTGQWTRQPHSEEPLVARGRLPAGVKFTRTSFAGDRLRFDSQGHLMGINRSIFLENSQRTTKKITVYASGNIREF